jgi:hypothetical protein
VIGSYIVVLTDQRPMARHITRAVLSSGSDVRIVSTTDALQSALDERAPDLLILDCDADPSHLESVLQGFAKLPGKVSVVLLSIGVDKQSLAELIRRNDVSHLVAKHGAIRAVYPMLDERELLVTCEKLISRNIFGLDKYIGTWGVLLHRATITSMSDKSDFTRRFEQYLRDLDCPGGVVPEIVTVAEELILNAVVHAPRLPDGSPKYEHLGPRPDLVLEPREYVQVAYGCDGRHLMVSVSDNFGSLSRQALYNYLTRGFGTEPLEVESKAGGAGLGLSLSVRSMHQLIFNVQDSVRTEAIAGWYIRVANAREFKQVAKSLNLFWLPARSEPLLEQEQTATMVRLSGNIDQSTDLARVGPAVVFDLREVTQITPSGLTRWLKFIRDEHGRVEIRACPPQFVHAAVQAAEAIKGVGVRTLLVPGECMSCGRTVTYEKALPEVFQPTQARCAQCGGALRFAGERKDYERFLDSYRAVV